MNKWAPKATFKAGDIYFKDLKKYKLAYGAYKRLLQFYGSSRFATTARDRLRKLSIYYTPPPQKNKDQSALAAVNNIRHWTGPRYTRVVIDLTRRVPYSNEVIKTPDRLFIDLDRARVSKKLKGQSITISDGLLKRVRVAQYTRDTVRVVLDIDRIESYKIIELDNPFRVIIDVNSKAKKKRKAVAVKAKTKKSDSNGKLSLAKQLGLGIETIVIDPGHGGKDPGAIGRKGAMEKDIVLDIAKKLKKIIEKGTGRRAYLTRYTDVFVPLEERTAIANTREADLFVSLHVNANSLSSVRGLETYYLSLATTREEREIAARENQTSFKKIRDLQKILESMLLNSKKEESRDLAHHMQSALITGLKSNYQVRDLGVKKAPFHVLIGAQMPSILTEISFITNPKDEKMLTTNRYRQAVALEIFHGLESYIASMKAHPNTASR
jgi:N-acetylmuramoyl-L-alanine amidase